MSIELELEVARAKIQKDKTVVKGLGKISKADIRKAIANGGELIMPPDLVDFTIKFGKYKGKTYNWVYQNDLGWMTWAFENVAGFKAQAEAANYKQT